VPAIACEGTGVVETFLAASRAMIERLVTMAEPGDAPVLGRGRSRRPTRQGVCALPGALRRRRIRTRAVTGQLGAAHSRIVRSPHSAVASSVELGAQLAEEHGRASRLEREAESLRRLSDVLRSTGASFDRDAVVDAALESVIATLAAAGSALGSLDASAAVQARARRWT